jgi:hypothetical protein
LQNGNVWKNQGSGQAIQQPDGGKDSLALAGFGGFLHLPLFGYDCHIEQAERQNHHHENECHEPNIMARTFAAKITVVPAQ